MEAVGTNNEEFAAKSDSYVLNRDYQASSRLNLQYFLWKSTLGFTLHPSIPRPTSVSRVADIATGTGIWLVDLASSLPSTTQLDGFDISLSQAPVSGWLPKNVSMREWDMFQDPPANLVGQYDIVHIRLVTLVIKDNNATTLVKNLHKLLKPGGYLQWSEIDTVGNYIDRPDPSVSVIGIEGLFTKLSIPKSARGRDDWKASLGKTMDENGFQNSVLHTYKQNSAMGRYWHDMYMQSWEEFATRVLGSTEHTYGMINQAVEEAQNGAVIVFPIWIWTAKKI